MAAYSLARVISSLRISLLALLLIIAPAAHAQILDLNANGTSDIWELIHGAEGLDPNLDSDRDGVPNRLEATAGTDPFDSRSVTRVSEVRLTTNGAQVTINVIMSGTLGKRFVLEARESMGGGGAGSWLATASVIPRTNAVVTFSTPAARWSEFFRITVADVDTDGDGLNDWEEYQLGLDPLSPTSNGQLDAKGMPLNDYQYITGRWASQPLANLLSSSARKQMQKRDPLCGILASAKAAGDASLAPSGTGLTGEYFTNANPTYTNIVNFNPANRILTTNNAVIDFIWGPATTPNLSNGNYTVRWNGQVEPQYSELYFFETRSDDGVKLWVNDQLLIDRWQIQNATLTNAISLVAGVRYNIRLEYFNRGGGGRTRLSWFSASQPRQVIPSNRLYPASAGYAPGAVTSPLYAVAFVGQRFAYAIAGANTPLNYGASNLPPGLSYDDINGIIVGTPALAGNYDISIFSSNAVGVGEAVLRLDVIDTGSSVAREVWTGVPGTAIKDIPLHAPASQTNNIGNLEGLTNFGDNYGERVRGYLIAPVTGNYYFWIAGNSSAELWISN
ncbi:MAG TPA: PA14 domain-containing protein, partial [Methylomirabilota bacterium]|nr:PA14 domain-containing protein [Methylomirabilota bacterium]